MPTRSGKGFAIASDPPSPKTTSKKKQQRPRATRVAKRARADSDTLPDAPEAKPARAEAPAPKKQKNGPGGLRNAGRAEIDDIIDLTLSDDEPEVQPTPYGRTWDLPIGDGPEEMANPSGGRRAGQIAQAASAVPAAPGKYNNLPTRPGKVLSGLRGAQNGNRQHSQASSDARGTQLPGRWNTTQSNETIKASQDRTTGAPRNARPNPGPVRVMFTVEEAKLHLFDAHAVEPTATYLIPSSTANHLIPPYTLRAGEYVPFPVTKSYHLGAMGRYRKASVGLAAQKIDHDSANYVFDWGVHCGKRIDGVPRSFINSIIASPRLNHFLQERRGLRQALKPYIAHSRRIDGGPVSEQKANPLPTRPPTGTYRSFTSGNLLPVRPTMPTSKPSASSYAHQGAANAPTADPIDHVSRPAVNGSIDPKLKALKELYIFPFGQHYGKRFDQVSTVYLRSLEQNEAMLEKHAGLRNAFASHFPMGVLHHEVENYRFTFAPYKNKRPDEVPEVYLSRLAEEMDLLGNNIFLRHALRRRNDDLGRSNRVLDSTVRKFYKKKAGSGF